MSELQLINRKYILDLKKDLQDLIYSKNKELDELEPDDYFIDNVNWLKGNLATLELILYKIDCILSYVYRLEIK